MAGGGGRGRRCPVMKRSSATVAGPEAVKAVEEAEETEEGGGGAVGGHGGARGGGGIWFRRGAATVAATVAATCGGFCRRRKRKIFRRHVSRHDIGRTFVRLGAGFFVPPVRVPGWQKAFCQLVSAAAAGGYPPRRDKNG